MVRVLLLLLSVLLLPTVTLASPIDSLRKLLPRLEGEERTAAYRQLVQELDGEGDLHAIMDCLDEWMEYEAQQGNVEEEAKVRWNKIVVLSNYATDSLLLAEAPIQMNWFMHHNEWEFYYDTWDCKANVYLYSGRVQTALREAHNIMDDANVRENNFGRAVAYQQMGIIYESIGQYEQAIQVFRKCLNQLKHKYRYSEVLTNTYDYLCQTLSENGDYKEVLRLSREWEKCIQERISDNVRPRQLMYGTYIACLCTRAYALTKMGRHGEAEGELEKAEKMLDEQNTPLGKYRILLVRTNHALAKGNAKKALVYCDSLEKLGLEAGGDIELLRGDILTQMGHHAEAAKMFRSLYIGKDSTFTREMRMQLDELNTLYKVDELEMAGKLQRSRFMIGIGILLIIGLLIFTIYRFRASLKLAEEHEKLEQSYKELKIANKKAEESSKMKTNFIQQISHEIRTPLNILSGFTQVITTPGIELDESTKQEANQRITENTNRITGLVNKMLALSDANSQTMIECSDETQALLIAAQAIDASQIAQNQDIDFDLQIDPEVDGLMLRTNLQQATQALEMLLDNAQKFIYGKDPSTRQHRGRVTLQVTSNHKNVQFVVEDNGIGIAKRDASRIFEEFVQLDDYYEGTGIGLAISRSIARRMGGDVVLDTSYISGARFILRLPLGEANARKTS